jgi:hypothetical protein
MTEERGIKNVVALTGKSSFTSRSQFQNLSLSCFTRLRQEYSALAKKKHLLNKMLAKSFMYSIERMYIFNSQQS